MGFLQNLLYENQVLSRVGGQKAARLSILNDQIPGRHNPYDS